MIYKKLDEREGEKEKIGKVIENALYSFAQFRGWDEQHRAPILIHVDMKLQCLLDS